MRAVRSASARGAPRKGEADAALGAADRATQNDGARKESFADQGGETASLGRRGRPRGSLDSSFRRCAAHVTSTSVQRAGGRRRRPVPAGKVASPHGRLAALGRDLSPLRLGTGGSMPRAGGQPTGMQPRCNPAGPTVAATAEGGHNVKRRGHTTATGRLRVARRP
jgi:hypothetical protein